METINLSKNVAAAMEERSRATISNCVALGHAVLKSLIGNELANNPDIDLELHLTAVIGNRLESKLRG